VSKYVSANQQHFRYLERESAGFWPGRRRAIADNTWLSEIGRGGKSMVLGRTSTLSFAVSGGLSASDAAPPDQTRGRAVGPTPAGLGNPSRAGRCARLDGANHWQWEFIRFREGQQMLIKFRENVLEKFPDIETGEFVDPATCRSRRQQVAANRERAVV